MREALAEFHRRVIEKASECEVVVEPFWRLKAKASQPNVVTFLVALQITSVNSSTFLLVFYWVLGTFLNLKGDEGFFNVVNRSAVDLLKFWLRFKGFVR